MIDLKGFATLNKEGHKVLATSTLMQWLKNDLISLIRQLENNWAASLERVENQYNLLRWYQEKEPKLSEDGTLTVTVPDGSKVTRVMVCGENHQGDVFYPEDDKYAWHDLRKNPEDLPKLLHPVLTQDEKNTHYVNWTIVISNKPEFIRGQKDIPIIAWQKPGSRKPVRHMLY